MAQVRLEHVTKSFGEGDKATKAVDDVSIVVEDRDFMILLGPSGCGKSTLLRMVAGLETPTAGDVFIGDVRVNNIEPKMRDVAMVFQSYALYPHMTVAENMGFSLRLRNESRKLTEDRVAGAAKILNLQDYLHRYPRELSGGQRQRV
ncbi:MAG TPA: ABC transporter ATP-binding protein, partial [Ilumatobacteraceae bacterium]